MPTNIKPVTNTDTSPVIDMTGIKKSFYIGTENELEVLHGIDLTVMPGEFLSIVGQSGSGKSTLMNIIGLLDKPTSGSYILNSSDISLDSDEDTSHIRNKEIGFVFQTYNLIPRMSALKNIELPMLYAGVHGKARKERAEELLELVGMTERMQHTRWNLLHPLGKQALHQARLKFELTRNADRFAVGELAEPAMVVRFGFASW